MNISKIKEHIKKVSINIDNNEKERIEKDNVILQDFILWLIGYLDGTEDSQADEIRKIREKISALKEA